MGSEGVRYDGVTDNHVWHFPHHVDAFDRCSLSPIDACDIGIGQDGGAGGKIPTEMTSLEKHYRLPGVVCDSEAEKPEVLRTGSREQDLTHYDFVWNACDSSREEYLTGTTMNIRCSSSATPRSSFASERLTYQCVQCQKTFTSEKYLRMHHALHRTWLPDLDHCKNVAIVKPTMKAAGVAGVTTQWSCNVCGKSFAQNSNYKNHVRTHSEERPFVCDICCIGFKERYHLKKHMLFKHTRELNEQCGHCGKRFKDSTAVRAHERIHSDARPYICIRCGKAFKTSECLWHHDHRSKTCGRQGARISGSAGNRHMSSHQHHLHQHHHPQQQQQQGFATMEEMERNTRCGGHQLIGSGFLACKLGDDVSSAKWPKTFRKPDMPLALLTPPSIVPEFHASSYTGSHDVYPVNQSQDLKFEVKEPPIENCITGPSKSPGSDSRVYHAENGASGGLGCRYQQPPGAAGLPYGCSSRNGKKRAVCGTCGKHFVSAPAFDKHMLMHSESRPYRCTICDIGFKLKVHLKKHNLYRHNSDYPCKCSVCGKRFKDSSAVRLHERIHSNERPFQCQCGKSFKTRENLWGHRHRRPCLKYTLEQGDARLKRRKNDTKKPEVRVEAKPEVLSGVIRTSLHALEPQGGYFHAPRSVERGGGGGGGGGGGLGGGGGGGGEYGFCGDQRSNVSSEYLDVVTISPEVVDVKPVIASGRTFPEPHNPYQLDKMAAPEANSPLSLAAPPYNLSAAHEPEVGAFQANNSLPPFETLISALRSCAGYSPEVSPISGQQMTAPMSGVGQHKVDITGCFSVSAPSSSSSSSPPDGVGVFAPSGGGCGWDAPVSISRHHLSAQPAPGIEEMPVVDLSMQQPAAAAAISYLTEESIHGRDAAGEGGGGGDGVSGAMGDFTVFGGRTQSHQMPLFFWDDDPWVDPRLASSSHPVTWHEADSLLTDLSVRPVFGLL